MNYQELISQMTLEEKCSLLSGGTQFTTKSLERLGIKSIFLSDGPHGIRKQAGAADHLGLNPSLPATCYPVAAAVANSWDTGLAEEIGMHLGREASSQGVSVLLGPGLNIKRNPLCGRNFEYFSEDPYLSGKMAASYIKGIQSEGISACPKHFAVNSQETFRMANSSIVDERTLREIYLTGFEIAVKEGKPKAIMTSYNLVNDEYVSESCKLQDDILAKEWGFDGMVVTDWGGSNDRVKGLIAGCHLEMPATKGNSDREILAAVAEGRISEELIDKRAGELLQVWMDIVLPESSPAFDTEKHHQFARRAAGQSVVLLKNEEHLLPLPADTKVAVIGDFAESPRYQGAGSSLVNCTKLDIPLEQLKQSSLTVVGYAQGFLRRGGADEEKKQEAVELAKKAEVILLYMGLDEISESEGMDRKHMKLNENQVMLLESIALVNPNIVIVLSAASSIEMPWEVSAKAIVHGYLGGQAGAGAIIDVLTGKTNPSGKLAESYPIKYEDVPNALIYPGQYRTSEYREGLYVGYRYFEKTGMDVRYPFGYGLSYTEFTYEDLKLTDKGVSFVVKNAGSVAGAEIAQLYVSCKNDSIFAPVKELKGFAKLTLQPGESRNVTILYDDKTFRYYHPVTECFEIIGGEYEIMIGASSADIRLGGSLTMKGTTTSMPYSGNELRNYFSGEVTRVSDSEFEKLLGFPLPSLNWDNNAPLTRNQPIASLGHAKSGIARLVFKILNNRMEKAERKGEPDLNILFIYNMPFRGIARMMGGMVDIHMVDAILVIVNGHFLKGCSQLIRSYRKMRKEQKGGIT